MGMDLYKPGNHAAYSSIRVIGGNQCFESHLKVDDHIPDNRCFRVTSLEQLKLAEFRGEFSRPKAYENGNKKVLDLELNN